MRCTSSLIITSDIEIMVTCICESGCVLISDQFLKINNVFLYAQTSSNNIEGKLSLLIISNNKLERTQSLLPLHKYHGIQVAVFLSALVISMCNKASFKHLDISVDKYCFDGFAFIFARSRDIVVVL